MGQGNAGTWNYIKSMGDVKLDIAYANQGGGSNADGASNGAANVTTESSWGMAVTAASW